VTVPSTGTIGDRRRVAVVLHEPQLGGATTSLLRVLPLLEARGWEFCFWVPGRGDAERDLRRRGYDVATSERLLRFSLPSMREHPGPARRLASVPAYLRSFRAWLKGRQAALVHANTLLALPELVCRPRRGLPALLHAHEVLPAGPRAAVAGRLARQADVVVAVSSAVASTLRGRGVESVVVHPGVRSPLDRPREGREDGRLVVGTLATVCRRKGSDLFLAAAQRVCERRNGIEFRMVGDLVVGGERAWAERVLEAARRWGVVHRAGVEPYAELAEWDIFVLPSRMDPCPLAVLEAMATGLSVVASRVGGIPEELGGDGGLLVEPEDVEGIAAAVLRLAGAPELRDSLGAAARRRVERLFTLERQADGLERAYRATLEVPDH
jgi:glycosyltransferase involved in cell wall biosynthesis